MSMEPNHESPLDKGARYHFPQLIAATLLVFVLISAFTYAVSKGWINVREFNLTALAMPFLAGLGIGLVNNKYLREAGGALLPIGCIITFLISFSGVYIMKSFQIRKTPDMEYWINVFLQNLPFALAAIFLYFLYAWLSETQKPVLMLLLCIWKLLLANLMFTGIIKSPHILFPLLFTGSTIILCFMHWNQLPKVHNDNSSS